MKSGNVISIGLLILGVGPAGGCVRQDDLEPPAVVQLTCSFDGAVPPMTVIIDTGLETARWVNLPTPRSGQARVSAHQYHLEFPAGAASAVQAGVNRYDATVVLNVGAAPKAVRHSGRCEKSKTGPRL